MRNANRHVTTVYKDLSLGSVAIAHSRWAEVGLPVGKRRDGGGYREVDPWFNEIFHIVYHRPEPIKAGLVG